MISTDTVIALLISWMNNILFFFSFSFLLKCMCCVFVEMYVLCFCSNVCVVFLFKCICCVFVQMYLFLLKCMCCVFVEMYVLCFC